MLVAAVVIGMRMERAVASPTARGARMAALPPEPLSLEGAAVHGRADAPFGIVIFSDFQCPFSRRLAADVLPSLRRDYVDTGKALIAFRHMPIETIHPRAVPAARAAACAGAQGRFWPVHDRLFAQFNKLADRDLRAHAQAAGVEMRAFGACMAGTSDGAIDRDRAEGLALSVRGTPSIFIGAMQSDGRLRAVRHYPGALPFEQFQQTLDALLRERSVTATK
ncbi:MAG: DsbA family protein [Acidobacteriota bacterium]|nr:DsbA family protein [Acidobacteriota bacterium]